MESMALLCKEMERQGLLHGFGWMDGHYMRLCLLSCYLEKDMQIGG